MSNQKCHPGIKDTEFTCYNHNQLKKIAEDLNKKGYNIKIKRSKADLWNEIRKSMFNKCNNEWCWINKTNTDLKKDDIFRPKHPNEWIYNRTAWLSNFDIEDVMDQYEEVYNDFLFIGPVPIDFKLVVNELANINLIQLYRKGIRKLGIIFNLDPHDKGGSHWVAMFLDMTNKKQSNICYYDSYGYLPEQEIIDLMTTLIAQGNCGFDGTKCNEEEKINIEPLYNGIRHQFKNSECGMYCIYFIVRMLERKNQTPVECFEKICINGIDDDSMNRLRGSFFITDEN